MRHSYIYLGTFLYSVQFFFVFFINSSFLGNYFSETIIGLLFALAAFINLFIFLNIGKILNRTGNWGLMVTLIFLEFVSLLLLAYDRNFILVAIAFVILQMIEPLLVFNLDIFLDRMTKAENIGRVRGIFLTLFNLPPVFIPFIAGLLVSDNQYWRAYLAAAIFLVPLFLIVVRRFRNFQDEIYHVTNSASLAREIEGNVNVYDILLDNLLLNFFFAWMTIYIPIYLHQYIGFSWPELGIIFSVMLLPFLLFQIPLGQIEDRKYGEQEILIIGFIIMGLFTMLIPFIHSTNLFVWMGMLFLTRVGASFVEVSAETYFFKQVSTSNIHLIGLFRLSRNLPYIFVPAIVSLLLVFISFKFIFLVLGLIMLSGLRYSFLLKDTR